ncbi:MAG: hypothetical protein JNL22_11310, partial [Bacteroidales bacterium]|nr:hypothetical protein [Bacteroidales bacterium]
MKRPVYKLLSLMAMASLLLLTMAPVMAQTHTVYAGQTSELGVQELPGHTYEWDLFTDDVSINFAVTPGNCPAVNAYFNGPSTGPTVSVTWLIPGVYYYRVIATDPKGCSNLRMGMMTVLNAAPVAIIEDMSPICEGDQTTLTINLTGTSPWSLDLDDGSAIITYSNILASPFILNISPLTTTYFTVTSLTDANTTNANPSNTVELIVNPLPAGSRIYHYDPVSLIVSNDIPYVIDSVCTGSERNYRIDGEPGSTYSWALTDPGGNTTLLAGSNDHISIQWNLAPGDYTLTAIQTGTLGCSSTETGIIRVFEPPAALAGNNAVLCNSDPYTLTEATASNYSTLSWSSSGDGTFDNAAALHPIYTFGTGDLAAGNITLTLTVQGLGRDETCTAATSSLELIITNLATTASSVPASCSAASDGSVTITASDGTEPYSFTLEGNTQPTGEFTGLAPGSYNYSVADATGCTLSGEVTVGALDPITAELLQTNVDCFGASNGEITVANASGGSGLFEFSIDLINWQPETSFTGLAAGNYTISARDANAPLCLYELGTITLTEPEILAATLNFTNETFAGANDGTITVSAPTGGSGSYEYSIDGITWQASGNFTALIPGTYDVLIRDANAVSCSLNLGQVEILPGGSLTATVTFTDVTCFGAADGSITLTDPQNGSGSYEYSIDGGVNWQSSGLFTGLTPDAYAVVMRDANEVTNVTNLGTVTISEPAILAASVTSTNETFAGANDGTITVSAPTGGSGTYEYSIDGINWQASGNFTALVPGTYDVLIRDANAVSCSLNLGQIEILPGGSLTATVAFTNVTCFGAADGSISITDPQNGSGSYEYSIDGGANWQPSGLFTGLTPDAYAVVMRDANEVTNVANLGTVTISEPAELAASVTSTNESFAGANDGTITVNAPAGGSGSYEYSIDGISWQASGNFTALVPGTYDVLIRDANAVSCSVNLGQIEILPGGSLTATVAFTNVTCFGAADGSITITDPQNGSGSYEYSIDGGVNWQTSGLFTGLTPDAYAVVMRDANEVTNVANLGTVNISEPAVLAASVTSTNETFAGANDGTITVSAPTGGSGTYEYSIDGISWQASGNFTALVPGTYDVLIRDANAVSCSMNLGQIEILPGGSLTATVAFTNVTCFGAADGSITITDPQNGSGSYEYSIDGGVNWQTSGLFMGLTPDAYAVMMRDANEVTNAANLGTVTISEPAELAASVTSTNETFAGANDGTITVSAPTGGSGTYEYSIDGISWQASGNFTALVPGTYDVLIRDANAISCSMNLGQVVILSGGSLTATVAFTNVTCFGAADGSITITDPQNGSGSYEYSIDGGVNWQISGLFMGLTPDAYAVVIRDANEVTNIANLGTITISEPAVLAASVTSTNETFAGANDGTITVSAPTGGSGSYEYSIDGITWQASGNFTALIPGTYDVLIRDANAVSCSVNLGQIEILPGGSLTATVAFTNVTCFGAADGSITITDPQNGSGSYEYSIDGGANWQTSGLFTGLTPDAYAVVMRDANELTNVVNLGTVTISEPAVLAASVTSTNETFAGAN